MPPDPQLNREAVPQWSVLFQFLASHPEWWEWLYPPQGPGPIARAERAERLERLERLDPGGLDRVALNPQPLPPKAHFALRIQHGLMQIADAAVTASAAGLDVSQMLDDVEGELCPSPPPPFPWPHHFRVPVPPGEPYPIDVEHVAPLVQAQAAIVFQSYADGIADDTLRGRFTALANRCGEAAAQQQLG
jgi:hypothetical protein